MARLIRVDVALGGIREGMDFADPLHLAKSGQCGTFPSFDRKLAKSARVAPVPVKAP